MSGPKDTPEQMFKKEHRSLLERWVEESDIDDMRIAEIAIEDTNEWLDEDIVEFDSEIELED